MSHGCTNEVAWACIIPTVSQVCRRVQSTANASGVREPTELSSISTGISSVLLHSTFDAVDWAEQLATCERVESVIEGIGKEWRER